MLRLRLRVLPSLKLQWHLLRLGLPLLRLRSQFLLLSIMVLLPLLLLPLLLLLLLLRLRLLAQSQIVHSQMFQSQLLFLVLLLLLLQLLLLKMLKLLKLLLQLKRIKRERMRRRGSLSRRGKMWIRALKDCLWLRPRCTGHNVVLRLWRGRQAAGPVVISTTPEFFKSRFLSL